MSKRKIMDVDEHDAQDDLFEDHDDIDENADDIVVSPDESEALDEILESSGAESSSGRSVFLDNVRMEIHDEGATTHCKQNFLFAAAAGRISTVLRLEPNFSKYVPELLKDTQRLQKIVGSAAPEELESWIELHNSHSPIGFLTTFWMPPKSKNPIFMMRKFQYDVANSSQYVVSWFGDDMKSGLPLGKFINVNYVQRGRVMSDTPVHMATKKSALAMSALLLTAFAYKLDNSLISEHVAVQETLSSLLPDVSSKDFKE